MLDSTANHYRRPLRNSLVLCTAAAESDVERVAAFNAALHGPTAARLTYNLFIHHPNTRGEDLVFVVDEDTDQIVSSLCLIPWTWRFEGVDIPTGELGIVGTLESYRHRGLIRAQVDYFERQSHQRGCLLSQIQGIPYFYRQFEYEYALPLEGGLRLELRQIPDPPDTSVAFRLADQDDLATLEQLYAEATLDLAIHTARDQATWQYLLTHSKDTETECERWIIEEADGRAIGYVGIPRHHFGEELTANEVSCRRFEAGLAVLHHLKGLAVARDKPGIRLNLPANCTLVQLARSLDAHDLGTYAWQIRVPDIAALLRALAPVLEQRVAASPFSGLTRSLQLSLYRERVELRFETGKLAGVARLGRAEGEVVLYCPPLQFVPLVLGYRTWRELRSTYPDVSVPPIWRNLVDTLFPAVRSFLYPAY